MDVDTMQILRNNSVYARFHYYLKLASSDDDIQRFINNFICHKVYTLLRDEIQYFYDHDEYEQEAKKLTRAGYGNIRIAIEKPREKVGEDD